MSFELPDDAIIGETFARFRLSAIQGVKKLGEGLNPGTVYDILPAVELVDCSR